MFVVAKIIMIRQNIFNKITTTSPGLTPEDNKKNRNYFLLIL